MRLIAIDPGPSESAYCLFDGALWAAWKVPNEALLAMLRQKFFDADAVICERIRSYGMPAGAELFETCEWCGRFQEAWSGPGREGWYWMARKDVKITLCGTMKAKDANIRQAALDRFGGKQAAIGNKKTPGPLYGVSGDMWAAIAVALAWQEMQEVQHA